MFTLLTEADSRGVIREYRMRGGGRAPISDHCASAGIDFTDALICID